MSNTFLNPAHFQISKVIANGPQGTVDYEIQLLSKVALDSKLITLTIAHHYLSTPADFSFSIFVEPTIPGTKLNDDDEDERDCYFGNDTGISYASATDALIAAITFLNDWAAS